MLTKSLLKKQSWVLVRKENDLSMKKMITSKNLKLKEDILNTKVKQISLIRLHRNWATSKNKKHKEYKA